MTIAAALAALTAGAWYAIVSSWRHGVCPADKPGKHRRALAPLHMHMGAFHAPADCLAFLLLDAHYVSMV